LRRDVGQNTSKVGARATRALARRVEWYWGWEKNARVAGSRVCGAEAALEGRFPAAVERNKASGDFYLLTHGISPTGSIPSERG
jgi:hypothetical protein